MIYRSILVTGLVQGVSFRYSTKKKAQELQIYGNVQNLKDGSVYIEAMGTEKNMRVFIKWCHQGPAAARVDKIDLKTLETKSFSSFDILR